MPTADQTRIAEDRARPRILQLWWALRPLTSTIRFMNSGAHPDDETSAMLAALAFQGGMNLSFVCSTRGEGGQNDIGTEAGADLGALRTREMERACDVLGMRMYWLSESPDDPVTDFGFSKSGTETLGIWGHARMLARFVQVVRQERPDILCPTFLDIPGQHGHHRAMTQAAHEVMAAAADPGFDCALPPWQIAKLYLPAWSGGGRAYDDAEPPPPATLTVQGRGGDPVSGWSWERIGQQSRACHRTQGMGRWAPPGAGRDFPLHLAQSHVPGPDTALTSGLPVTLADLAELEGAGRASAPLRAAQAAIDTALAAFPDFGAVETAARSALDACRAARAACPAGPAGQILHRVEAKEVQLGHVLRLARGIEARAYSNTLWLYPGASAGLVIEASPAATVSLDLPEGWVQDDAGLRAAADAPSSDPYPAAYDPAAPAAPALVLHMDEADVRLPFEAPPVLLPGRLATLGPETAVINRKTGTRRLPVSLSGLYPEGADPTFDLPEGWNASRTAMGLELRLPEEVPCGLHTLGLRLDRAPAQTARRIHHDHVAPTARARPAELRLLVLDVAVPEGRIGYAGSGHDRAGHWLSAIGADVTDLTDADLASDAALAGFDTIVIGIFALRFRPGLADCMARIARWVEAGGTLVTLYHRPWDNWDPDRAPPRRLEIGQPSLRWRVTDPAAPVTVLADHPVLHRPNPIGPEDWDGWVKERGLYFAKSWDDAYQPLLEMADAEEPPLQGALLAADIGRGRHVHCALIVHLQMEALVPGAFRLMANMAAPRKE